MAQRHSDFPRIDGDDYATPPWVATTVSTTLKLISVREVWEPAAGAGQLAHALRLEGFAVKETGGDFLQRKLLSRHDFDAIVTNPPYGKKSDLACAFIRHALSLPVRVVAMLLRVDFDSAKTRADIFRDNPRFLGKIVLLDRIVWFEQDGASPSENHAWFIWGAKRHVGQKAWISYAAKP